MTEAMTPRESPALAFFPPESESAEGHPQLSFLPHPPRERTERVEAARLLVRRAVLPGPAPGGTATFLRLGQEGHFYPHFIDSQTEARRKVSGTHNLHH